MKYYLTVLCFFSYMTLHAYSSEENYQTIKDNAPDYHQENELGENKYPDLVKMYKNNRDATMIVRESQKKRGL